MFEAAGSRRPSWETTATPRARSRHRSQIRVFVPRRRTRRFASALTAHASPAKTPNHAQHIPAALRHRVACAPAYARQGRHVIRLALCFQSPQTPRENLAPTLADTLFTPPLSYRGRAVSAGLLGLDGGQTWSGAGAKPASDSSRWCWLPGYGSGKIRRLVGTVRWTLLGNRLTTAGVQTLTVNPYELISLQGRHVD